MKKPNYYPLIGILVSKGRKKNTFCGNQTVFKSIQKKLMEQGGLSFVFTLEDITEDSITGYIFLHQRDIWGKAVFPFPDLIYNRISTRNEEVTSSFLTLKTLYKQRNMYFFNPCFFEKWDSYRTLSNSKLLLPHLPDTWLYKRPSDLIAKLHSKQSLFVKPVNGHKGKGIYRIDYDGLHFFIHNHIARTKYNREELVYWSEAFLRKDCFLLQDAIQTDKIENCKYDLRILCLYNQDKYTIIGIGVRKANLKSILTHVPNGGEILPFDQIRHKCNLDQLNKFAEEVGRCLSKRYGFIGEFSIDVGLTPNGYPYIFEVNSKPMIFDESEIQENRITKLVKLFTQLAKSTSVFKKDI